MIGMAQEEVYRGDEMANPPGIKAFTVDRHSFVETFMYFRTFCVVQSPPLVFVPSREFECSPPLVQTPGRTLRFWCALV